MIGCVTSGSMRFLSTLPARGATGAFRYAQDPSFISIHAPREGSDPRQQGTAAEHRRISIHAPREGSDVACVSQTYVDELFLSTLPARGATHALVFYGFRFEISIHAPREGSDLRRPAGADRGAQISIHAPREGSDSKCAEK